MISHDFSVHVKLILLLKNLNERYSSYIYPSFRTIIDNLTTMATSLKTTINATQPTVLEKPTMQNYIQVTPQKEIDYVNKIKITNLYVNESNDMLYFTLTGVNLSFANAIRRVVLSEIDVNVIRTETENINQCKIFANSSRLHNEIIKHRLSCIPIHHNDKGLNFLPDNYELEVKVENTGDEMMFVTTEDFKLKNISTGEYLPKEVVQGFFPPDEITRRFIDFVRLRPKIGNAIPGEKLELTAQFSISNAKENAMFNVASVCSYSYTTDIQKVDEQWAKNEKELRAKEVPDNEIEFQKKNFYILDSQRHFVEDSFDFVLKTLGIYTNEKLVVLACEKMIEKLNNIINSLNQNKENMIVESETTMDNSFDVILEDEDYTLGKVLEFMLFDKYYLNNDILSFCGFKKYHPHNTHSKLRVAFKSTDEYEINKNTVAFCLKKSAAICIDVFKKIADVFSM